MNNERKVGNLLVGLGVFIFGINFVSMKYLLGYVPPFPLIFLRFAIASIFFWGIIKFKIVKNQGNNFIAREDKREVIITGFLGVAIFYFFNSLGLTYIDASLGALICALIPIFTLLTNVIMYKKKCDVFVVGSFVFATFGVWLVLDMKAGQDFDVNQIIGITLMLLAVFSWIAYTIKTFRLQQKYNSLFLLYRQTAWATLLLFFVALPDFSKAVTLLETPEAVPAVIANLLFVGIVCSALGYLFYMLGMEKTGVEVASLYMNLIPAITTVVSYFVLGEAMSVKKVVGIGIVLISLYAVGMKDMLEGGKVVPKKAKE